MTNKKIVVPAGLRTWFVIHFFADILFAIPLLLVPRPFLTLVGWTTYDPVMTRLVAAALFGIGIESLLGRNANVETYRAMLNLKVIWATAALFAIAVGIFEGAASIAWVFLGIFVVFWIVWVYYRITLEK